MLNKQELEDIYTVAEKMKNDISLTAEEHDLYDDILDDDEYYDAFCLYTTLMDLPELYEDAASWKEMHCTKEEFMEKHLEKDKNL